jgi:hypothetical protein
MQAQGPRVVRPTDAEIFTALPRKGYAEAFTQVAFTSAPLLAGFAITFIGLILGSEIRMYWPNVTLAALTGAAMLLIFSIQLAFTARIDYLPYSEFEAQTRLIPGQDSYVRREYVASLRRHRKLVRWAGATYNLGIAALLAGIAAALVPSGTAGHIDTQRVLAIVIAALAAIAEIIWTLTNELKPQAH